MILRLGSGEAAARSCGPKAALLDRAARAGLPVPSGVIVLDEAWRSALARGLVRLEGSGARRPVSVPDPSLLVHLIGMPPFAGPLAVRAAFSSEEGGGESLTGELVPGLFVEGGRAAALAAGLAGVWASALSRPRGFRRDLIAQAMVRARAEGVAFLQPGYEDDIVESTDSGPVAGVPRSLPRLRRTECATEAAPVAVRLQVLLRAVRRVFGDGDWLVEWADDGARVWLVQIGDLPRLPRRNEAFTATSHRDLLRSPPSMLTTTLVASCAPGLFAHYQRFDGGLPVTRPLVEILHGRPWLNLTLLTDMVRRWGLPTWLVTESMGGTACRAFGFRPGRMIHHAPVMVRLLRAQVRAVRSARATAAAILERTACPPDRLAGVLDELGWLHGVLLRERLTLTAASSGPLAVLRRWSRPDATLGSRLLRPVSRHAERLQGAREGLHSAAMVGSERLRARLLEQGRPLADEGVLPAPEALFDLTVEEARRLDEGFRPDAAFWDTRRGEIEAHRGKAVPDPLHRG